MNYFTRNLITEWRRLDLPFENASILVAVSGGADSCALALGLAELRDRRKLQNEFIVAHFDHMLRGDEGKADAVFTEEIAARIGFGFVLGRHQGDFVSDGNVEQTARNARYGFLTEAALERDCSLILTAHTRNDQAETLLLNLIRGSGIEGLSGMRAIRGFDDHAGTEVGKLLLARPLLNWATRKDTERSTTEKGIEFRKDKMNEDTRFSRVKVRKELIPYLEKLNPNIVETLSHTAKLLRQDAEILSEAAKAIEISNEILPLTALKLESEARLQRLLRAWLKHLRGDLKGIDRKHIAAMVALIHSRKSGSICELPRGEKVIKRNGELLFVGLEVEKRF